LLKTTMAIIFILTQPTENILAMTNTQPIINNQNTAIGGEEVIAGR